MPVPLATAARLWLRAGGLAFGGPAAQVALLHRVVVEERRWLSEARFLQALGVCRLLPGPEAPQLAIWLGWLLHGVPGGLAAGLLVLLPGALAMLALAALHLGLGAVPAVAGLVYGLQCAALVLVAEALLRLARRSLRRPPARALALAAFLALGLFGLPFPLVILAAALAGLAWPAGFVASGPPTSLDRLLAAAPDRGLRAAGPARWMGLGVLLLWLGPVLLLAGHPPWGDLAWFFARLAVVNFGDAHAALAYVAQEAVDRHHWLSGPQLLARLGLAAAMPGPLLPVLQFVGTLAGYAAGGAAGGLAGAALALWMSALPCLAWVLLAGPPLERLRDAARPKAALAAVMAAQAGLLASLVLWFGLRLLFGALREVPLGPARLELPVAASLDPVAALLVLLAAVCLLRMRVPLAWSLAATALAGMVLRLAFGWLLGRP
ncbi:chromate efflux transporter [Roseicella frigidaeris]|uniref:Chromate transporter n=1 Tax=Roseicella frigidaeris TaxID=2230885 RepID=A0A327M5E1_9PROT|nr:chromate efflux transporter [Roseicella frigidaeris]RAI58511.1 chromate transporter [Roseicella frigidaeris]